MIAHYKYETIKKKVRGGRAERVLTEKSKQSDEKLIQKQSEKQ